MDIQERLTAFAMLGAEWVMWLLVLLSIIGLAIVLERAYFFIASMDNLAVVHEKVIRFLRAGNPDDARKVLASSKALEARIVSAGLDGKNEDADAAAERMASERQLSKLQMDRNLVFLGTVGNNAPFVGLLGTVIGIIQAFTELEQSRGQVTPALMEKIGESLVATAIGILVALPAVAFFNLYSRIIRNRMSRADALVHDVLGHLKKNANEASGDSE